MQANKKRLTAVGNGIGDLSPAKEHYANKYTNIIAKNFTLIAKNYF